MPKPDKKESRLLHFVKSTADISSLLWALSEKIDQYATDASGSPEHGLALAAAKKALQKSRDDLGAATLGLLAAHGAAQITPPAEQLRLNKGPEKES